MIEKEPPDFLFWSGFGWLGSELTVSNFVTLQQITVSVETEVLFACATWNSVFLLTESKVLRFERGSLPSEVCIKVDELFLEDIKAGWKLGSLILKAKTESFDSDSEFHNFGTVIFKCQNDKLASYMDRQRPGFRKILLSASENETFLVHNFETSPSELYRIHTDEGYVDSESRIVPQLLQHQLPESGSFVQLHSGKAHTLLLDSFGCVHSFGTGSRGELGHGSVNSEPFPVVVEALEGLKIVQIAAGGWHSAALTEFDDVYLWGWNESGQLGTPKAKISTSLEPVLLELPDDQNVSRVACGSRHTVILLDNGRCFSFGLSIHQNESEEDKDLPKQLSHESTVTWICAKDWTTILLCPE